MTRYLKTLGLALVAALALTAVVASAASAAAQFHSEAENTTVEATQTSNHVFTTPAGKVTCKEMTATGTQAKKTDISITLVPVYKLCTTATIFGTINVNVDFATGKCEYTFTSETGEVHIFCTNPGGVITIEGPGCKITVPPQTVKKAVYTNAATVPKHITVTPEVSGIKSTATGAFCSSTGESTTGTYTGTATAKGFSGGKQVGIWWE